MHLQVNISDLNMVSQHALLIADDKETNYNHNNKKPTIVIVCIHENGGRCYRSAAGVMGALWLCFDTPISNLIF